MVKGEYGFVDQLVIGHMEKKNKLAGCRIHRCSTLLGADVKVNVFQAGARAQEGGLRYGILNTPYCVEALQGCTQKVETRTAWL